MSRLEPVTRTTVLPTRRGKIPQGQFAPSATPASFMDMLKFEQRMVQNIQVLDSQRRRYLCEL